MNADLANTRPRSTDGAHFEDYLAWLLDQSGYQTQLRTTVAGHEIDVLARAADRTLAVECKAWTRPVGPGPIREQWAIAADLGVSPGIAVTSRLTETARTLASRWGFEIYPPARHSPWGGVVPIPPSAYTLRSPDGREIELRLYSPKAETDIQTASSPKMEPRETTRVSAETLRENMGAMPWITQVASQSTRGPVIRTLPQLQDNFGPDGLLVVSEYSAVRSEVELLQATLAIIEHILSVE